MKASLTSVLTCLILGSVSLGAPGFPSIALNLGADQSNVTGVAGVLLTENWNNLEGASSAGLVDVFMDANGILHATKTAVEWNANRTSNIGGLNRAPAGNDRNLMQGYLEAVKNEPTIVLIDGLEKAFTENGYDAYLYVQSNTIGSGGEYLLDFSATDHTTETAFHGIFQEGANGNYLLIEDLTAPIIELEVIARRGDPVRSAINAIELIAKGTAPGDFNGNGIVGIDDIEALSQEILAGTNNLIYDVNNDNVVDGEDRTVWLDNVRPTWFGDANVDGEFNTSDFVFVFQKNEFEDGIPKNSTWSEGDWNNDQEFDTSDFVLAFQQGGYESGLRRPPVRAVPEPSSAMATLLAAIFSLHLGRKRIGYEKRGRNLCRGQTKHKENSR